MQRLTITIDDDLVAEVDEFIAQRGYANRSEAFRDLVRSGLEHAGDQHDRQSPMYRDVKLHLRSRRPRVAETADQGFPRSPRSRADDASRARRPRFLS